jgi:site-specific recombinase XerD
VIWSFSFRTCCAMRVDLLRRRFSDRYRGRRFYDQPSENADSWTPVGMRHACGFKLANDGHDTRAIQAYLGHRSIMSTVRYTALTPNRFQNFWKD